MAAASLPRDELRQMLAPLSDVAEALIGPYGKRCSAIFCNG
jgi:hypothetical protein